MNREELESHLRRSPFIPLRLNLSDGRKSDVPFNHVIVPRTTDLILFKGVKKAGSHVAEGYEVLPYEQIDSIQTHRGGTGRRRRAS